MDDDDVDAVPVKDSNDNNNVKKLPRKGFAGTAKSSAGLAAAGTKRPSKTPHDGEVGRKRPTGAASDGPGDLPHGGQAAPASLYAKPPPGDAGDSSNTIRARQDVSRWDRAELEDKYLRLLDEQILLKQHCRKQEERIKKMSVKLIKLAADRKSAVTTAVKRGSGVAAADSAAVAETLAELEAQVKKLEKEKQQLEERYSLLSEQLSLTNAAAVHRSSQAYEGVPPRVDSGVKGRDPRVAKGLRVAGPPTRSTSGFIEPTSSQQRPTLPPQSPPRLPRYGHSLLEDAREQITYMESIIEQQNEQIKICEQEIKFLEEEMKRKERGFEEDLLRIKQEATGAQRISLQENVDLIRLQRDVKDKAARIVAMQAQYDSLEANMRALKDSHGSLLREMEGLNSQLLSEQSKNMSLQNQLKRNPSDIARIKELEESLLDAKKEVVILKEANEKLVSSAFDMEREREWRKRENALKVQIAQLEATLRADLGEKGSILDRLTAEREASERRETELRNIQREYLKAKEQCEQMQEKVKFFTKESAIDLAEVEEALILLKQRKEKETTDMSFLNKVEEEKSKDFEKQIMILQADYAETIEELEKTRNLLIVQHQINKDYQQEVDAVTKKMEENRQEYEAKLDEYAQLLDIRAARIQKLELQLRDVAYGTKQYKLRAGTAGSGVGGADDVHGGVAASDVEEIDETIHLERGENLFEIHIDKLALTREALAALGDDEPSLFCTWEFFEHETQATPVVKGPVALFDFTSQYIVKVDDFFLHHLQKESTVLEVHQALGTDYRTIAMCRLQFRDIFEKSHARLHGTMDICFEVAEDERQPASRVQLGTLSFWVRLRVPMDQALRLYKERTKALGYISSNEAAATRGLETAPNDARPDSNVNELQIKIVKVSNVKSRQSDVQPSPYCVYKFFDFPDHDTAIVTSSNSPAFNDLKVFPVVMAADLDSYLKSCSLEIFVFDDTDPEMAAYLGMASVPLMALAHDKAIKGTFELKKADGSVNGTIDVFLKWQCMYTPPDGATRIPAQGALARATSQMQAQQLQQQRAAARQSGLALMAGEQVRTVATTGAAAPAGSGSGRQQQQQQRNIVMLVDDDETGAERQPPVAEEELLVKQGKSSKAAISFTTAAQKVIRPVTGGAQESRLSESKGKVSSGAAATAASPQPKKTKNSAAAADVSPTHGGDTSTAAEIVATRSAQSSVQSVRSERSVRVAADRNQNENHDDGADTRQPPAKQRASADGQQPQPPQPKPSGGAGPTPASRRSLGATRGATAAAADAAKDHPEQRSLSPSERLAAAPGGGTAATAEEHDHTVDAADTDTSLTVTSLESGAASPVVREGAAKKGGTNDRNASGPTGRDERKFNTEITTEDEQKEDDDSETRAARDAAAREYDKSPEPEEVDDEDTRHDDGTLDGSGEISLPPDIGDGRESDEHGNEVEEEPEMLTDSEGVVSPLPRRSLSTLPKDGVVTVAVNHLSIEEGSPLLSDPAVQRLFVAYSFLDCDPAELETPVSLPKPDHLNRPLQYNFRRVFHVDSEANMEKRQILASMLLADAPEQGRLVFTVVSEPPEEDDKSECMDVGTASVSLLEIMKKKQDIIEADIDVTSVQNKSEIIGSLNVTVECLAVLESIKDEFVLT